MNKEREVRFLPLEIRAEQNEQEYVLEGYPIVFNQETDMGSWREVIDPAAIGDGRILRDNLRLTGRDRTWLDGCLRAQQCRREDVLLLTVDGSGVVHMQRKGTRK